jgi:hypothetical protein
MSAGPTISEGYATMGVGCATALARAGCSGGVVRGPFPGEIVRHAELNACAIAA